MCSSQPPEEGADSDPALWTHEPDSLPKIEDEEVSDEHE